MVQSRPTIIGQARGIRKLETETLMSHCQECSEMQLWGSSSSMTEGESCESSVAVYPGLLCVHITSDGNDYIIYSNDIHKIPSLMFKTIQSAQDFLPFWYSGTCLKTYILSSPSECFSSHKTLHSSTLSKEREKVLTFPWPDISKTDEITAP